MLAMVRGVSRLHWRFVRLSHNFTTALHSPSRVEIGSLEKESTGLIGVSIGCARVNMELQIGELVKLRLTSNCGRHMVLRKKLFGNLKIRQGDFHD
jgi:hypothetical protein